VGHPNDSRHRGVKQIPRFRPMESVACLIRSPKDGRLLIIPLRALCRLLRVPHFGSGGLKLPGRRSKGSADEDRRPARRLCFMLHLSPFYRGNSSPLDTPRCRPGSVPYLPANGIPFQHRSSPVVPAMYHPAETAARWRRHRSGAPTTWGIRISRLRSTMVFAAEDFSRPASRNLPQSTSVHPTTGPRRDIMRLTS